MTFEIIFARNLVKSAYKCISSRTHFYAPDDLNVGTIAFTSCYVPESMKGNTFWNDVRNEVRWFNFLTELEYKISIGHNNNVNYPGFKYASLQYTDQTQVYLFAYLQGPRSAGQYL